MLLQITKTVMLPPKSRVLRNASQTDLFSKKCDVKGKCFLNTYWLKKRGALLKQKIIPMFRVHDFL